MNDPARPAPAGQVPPTPPGGWDLLVAGGGTAGIVAAKTAAGLGATVLLAERERMGGDCLWTGCVPSKALLAVAARAASIRSAAALGVTAGAVSIDFTAVMQHVRSAIQAIEPADSVAAMQAAGVQVCTGSLRFTGPRTAQIGSTSISFAQAVLAMGAAPAVPPVPGLAEALDDGRALTSDTIWELTALPEQLVVLGGGSIGCELGQALARLGSAVTIVEAAPSLLPREDPEAAALVTAALQHDGVTVLTGTAVRQVAGSCLVLDDGRDVPFSHLLVATGRTPRTADQGLEEAGVRLDQRGFVQVTRHLRTTNPRVWAAGDLTGHPQFTHTAGVHASTAAANAVLGLRRAAYTAAIPQVTFTDPEVAAAGVPAAEVTGRSGWRVVTRHHHEVDRAVAEAEPDGFSRLVLDRAGRLRGATVVGPRAGESLAELALGIRLGLRSRDLAATMHAYPTYGDGPWNAALADVRRQLSAPGTARLIGLAVRARRTWLRWRR